MLLEHVAELAEEGAFGEFVRKSRAEYSALPAGLIVFLKAIDDFCAQNATLDSETRQFRDLFCKLLIAAYRDARRVAPEASEPFLTSLIADYPGAQESALLTRWCSLAQACLAFREVATSSNRNLIWQQMERTFVAYNEFLDGLFGFLLVLLRSSAGMSVGAGVFQCAYGNKVRQIGQLTGGDDGPYYLLTRIARPAIRNASAHGRLWLDSKSSSVHYVDGQATKSEKSMSLAEFAALALMGSHLTMPYFAAIGTLVTLDCGAAEAQRLLPPVLVKLWKFPTPGTG